MGNSGSVDSRVTQNSLHDDASRGKSKIIDRRMAAEYGPRLAT
jgi:hypothetical protein